MSFVNKSLSNVRGGWMPSHVVQPLIFHERMSAYPLYYGSRRVAGPFELPS